MGNMPKKGNLSPEEFVYKAIVRLRVPPYKGIHTVYSGFNDAFREYFPLLDPVDFTNQMSKEGKIVIRPAKGGVIIYKSDEVGGSTNVNDTLKRIIDDDDDDYCRTQEYEFNGKRRRRRRCSWCDSDGDSFGIGVA